MDYQFTTREWFLIDDMANGTGMTPEQIAEELGFPEDAADAIREQFFTRPE